MDEFNPEKEYNPEDEYTPVDGSDNAPQADINDDIPVIEPPVQRTAPVPQPEYDMPVYGQPVQQYDQPVQPQYEQPPVYQPYQPVQPQQYAQPQYGQPIQQQGYQQYNQPAQPVQPQQGYQQYYQAPQQGYTPPYQQPQAPAPIQPQPQQNVQPQYNQPIQQAQYEQPMNTENPYTANPYAKQSYNQPYQYQQPQQNFPQRPQKPRTSTGTKAFIIILCVILAAMLIGFIVYISARASKSSSPKNNGNNGFSISDGGEGSGNDPFGINNISGGYTDVEDEITLKEDKGDTQKREDDNPDSVGEPNKDAKNITLNELPKDKDSNKYTKQSSYETVSDSVVTVELFKDEITDNEKDIVAVGTGTIISADGYIITNAHVLSNSKAFLVNIVTNSDKKYQAKIIGYDTWTDLAVLKIDAKDLKPVTFGDSELVNVGDDVIAIGSPGGVKFQNSLTQGIVSAVDREISINRYVRYIQSDAAISPGNSGGPLCNIYGQVIGITTAKNVGSYYENMTFSIPSVTVEEIVGDLMRYGYVQGRARIGFSGTEVSQEEVYYYNYPQGVAVGTIDESGSLAGTDIKEGDIITEIDGEAVTSFQDIYDVLADHKAGDKVKIKAVRPATGK